MSINLKENHFSAGCVWECIKDKNNLIIRVNPFYRQDGFWTFLLFFPVVLLAILYYVGFEWLKTFYVLYTLLVILVYRYIAPMTQKPFEEFEIKLENERLSINNFIVNEVNIFAICNPDQMSFWQEDGVLGKHTQSEQIISMYFGFEIITQGKIYYAGHSFNHESKFKEMHEIEIFLKTNKIKFNYKYKFLRKYLITIQMQANYFEKDFDLLEKPGTEIEVYGYRRWADNKGQLALPYQ